MNATTINTFPPFQSMNSPRGWILALIVLLHFGFFLALSAGMMPRIVAAFRPPPVVVLPTLPEPPPPEPTRSDVPVKFATERVVIVEPTLPTETETVEDTITGSTDVEPPLTVDDGRGLVPTPIVAEPAIDPRIGLSEPLYPAAEIRAGHTGTVVLSIYVLENGRVGEVRLDQSSGYKRLDESALREARRWRLKPGMRDGVPIAMWKQLPVTFRLQSTGSTQF